MPIAKLPPAPDKLIGADGRPVFGNFAGPIAALNLDAFDYRALRRAPWTTLGLGRKLLKHWQFIGVIDEGLVFGAAVVDLSYIGSGFTYVYDRQTGKIVHADIKAPLAINTRFSPSPTVGVTEIRQGDKSVALKNDVSAGVREATVDFPDKLNARVTCRELGPGVSTSVRQMLYGFNYCYKSVAMQAEGVVNFGGQERRLSKNALALLDWSTGTPPRETIWNWCAAVGRDAKGRTVGVNFGCGLNEYSFHENTMWLDGQPYMLDGVDFAYDPKDVLGKPWRLSTADGAVDLTFQPDNERYENVNFGFIASRLHQPFGRLTGKLRFGKETVDAELYGFCEEHYAKW